MSNFFDEHSHFCSKWDERLPLALVRDAICDARLRLSQQRARLLREAERLERQRVLVVGVEVPARGDALQRIAAELARSRHDVTASLVPMQAKGKFENVADAIAKAPQPLDFYDWLIVVDDDVALPRQFTDRYLALAALADLTLSQPAHRFRSYATFAVNRRRPGTLVRRTGFVETGPLTVLRRDCFADCVPFPASRWAYGVDVVWSQLAHMRGWRLGVIDALPIRHTRPVAAGYDVNPAIAEGRELIRREGVTLPRSAILADHGECLPV